MSLQDKAAERERLIAEVRTKLEEYRASGRRSHLRSTIPLESRSIRQLKDVLRYWRQQEKQLTQPEQPEPLTPQAAPEPIMGIGVTQARQVADKLESQQLEQSQQEPQ